MDNFTVEFYRTKQGVCPIEEFLDSIEIKMRVKILLMMELLEEYGNNLREPYSKQLLQGIYELRVKQGNNHSRVLYFFETGRKIIITNGFIKKKKKTPIGELRKAVHYRQDYIKRRVNKNE